MSKILDGKAVSAAVKEQIKLEVEALNAKGIFPGLAVILVGNDPASQIYVRNKKKACEATGIKSFEYLLPENATQEEVLALIEKLNGDPAVSGILCQLPLPAHINEKAVTSAISPEKDVDAFNPVNVGKMTMGEGVLLPCTPSGIMEILKYYNIETCGKNCVVIGRSNIVGKPMALLLLAGNGTVTVCHSKTANLKEVTSRADILVSAVGKAGFVTADMVKPDAVVIDVGMNRTPEKLCGDVCFEEVAEKASYITPVPGGVGPMTIACLMKNTLIAAKLQNGEEL